jgi:hypothetical protein
MTPRHLLMAATLLGAAGLAFFGDKTPASDVAEPATRGSAAVAGTPKTARPETTSAASPGPSKSGAATEADVAILALHPRADLIGEAFDAPFDAKDGPFQSQNWQPPPPPPAKAGPVMAAAPAAAPPVPFAYVGKAASDGEWEVYLVRANKIYVARKDTLIDGIYRVEAIAPPSMSITYLPLNQVQQLNIGVSD